MRVFYIFKIKQEFNDLYKDNQMVLYNILKKIYNMSSYDMNYAKTLLNQLILDFDKELIDRNIFIKLHQTIPYSKRGNTHYMNNLYKDEISNLTVKNKYLKIETENKFSSFFNILNELDDNLFVCNFTDDFCFFLTENIVSIS